MQRLGVGSNSASYPVLTFAAVFALGEHAVVNGCIVFHGGLGSPAPGAMKRKRPPKIRASGSLCDGVEICVRLRFAVRGSVWILYPGAASEVIPGIARKPGRKVLQSLALPPAPPFQRKASPLMRESTGRGCSTTR